MTAGRTKRTRRIQRRRREGGVAVITALLLTTLAISIVASLFWQQQVQVRSMENQRLHLQTKWILRGALDWASLVLFQDGLDHREYTSLDQVWATPLAETRLDQYIERERVQGENFDASLSGNITDACSRYNLRNLADNGMTDPDQVEVFMRLLANLQIDAGQVLAQRTAAFVGAGQPLAQVPDADGAQQAGVGAGGEGSGSAAPGTAGGTGSGVPGVSASGLKAVAGRSSVQGLPMKFLAVDDLLSVPGFTPAIVERLRPFVIVLPDKTPVNVNTAPAEVLAAVANTSMSEANTMLVRRKQAPWRAFNAFDTETQSQRRGPMVPDSADVKSQWFLVNSRIRLDRAALDAEALVYRPLNLIGGGSPQVKWIRQY